MPFYPCRVGGRDSDIELIGVFPANKSYYEVGAGYKHSYTFTKKYSEVIAVANKSTASQSITATGVTLQDYNGSFANNFDKGCTAKIMQNVTPETTLSWYTTWNGTDMGAQPFMILFGKE